MKKQNYNLMLVVLFFFFLSGMSSFIYGQTYVIEYGSMWKYLDDGSDQGTAWKELAFDDAAWAEGPAPLGYNEDEATLLNFGEDPDNKYITYYFRKNFSITNASAATGVNLEFMVDDGLIIYLNGHDIQRMGLADSVSLDSVNYLTEFGDADEEGRTEDMVYTFSNQEAAAFLNEGLNVIAVEVHQSGPSSSDLRFHLQVTIDGDVETGVEVINSLPSSYQLANAYPNPFNPSTNIQFSLPERSAVKLEVFDALGRIVETLVNDSFDAGTYNYTWNASGVPSGIYFYRLTANNYTQTQKMSLLK